MALENIGGFKDFVDGMMGGGAVTGNTAINAFFLDYGTFMVLGLVGGLAVAGYTTFWMWRKLSDEI